MNTSFLKRQSTWVGILLAGLGIVVICFVCGVFRFKAENYLPLLKYSTNKDTVTYFNLGFESVFHDGWPKGWKNFGYTSYDIQTDSLVKHTGKYALRIEPKGVPVSTQYGSFGRSIPAIYSGKNITLKAFMRTEGVDQPIGLLLRIDGNSGILQFDNMLHKGITGSEKWEEYSVTLPLSEEAKTIYIAAIFSGKGKLWVDDFQLLIDNRDIADAKLKPGKIYLAEKDTEFDRGSRITINTYTPQTVANLELLGRIWGFLKYYHPAVAAGNYNWDAELFRIMPAIINVQNNEERNKILVEWIDRLGKLKPERKKIKAADTLEVKLLPDFAWMENPELGKTLSKKLKDVENVARSTDHYYAGLFPGVGNPVFKNEKPYPDMRYFDDSGMRLLALFRYWNMIEYFFPCKYLTDKNWNTVLGELIPLFLDGNKELDYKLALLQLIVHVNDTHANIWNDNALNRWKGLYIAPYQISFIEEKFVVADYLSTWERSNIGRFPSTAWAQSLGLKKGDIITHIDGKPVEEIVEERKPYYPASNISVQLRKIGSDLLRTKYENISIQIIRNGIPQTCEIACQLVEHLSTKSADKASNQLLSHDIGYIWPETLMSDSIPVIIEKFKHTKGIIIDFRCYPQTDFTVFTLGSYLTKQPIEFVKFTKGSIEQPGRFSFDTPLKVGNNNEQYYKGKVVIIVNEQTQSSAEYHVMAFQTAPQATVIGSITAAADGNVSTIVLPGNVETMITGIGVYYPDGRETQRVGIKLDMGVKPTIKGIIEGRDELLEKAMEIIKQQ